MEGIFCEKPLASASAESKQRKLSTPATAPDPFAKRHVHTCEWTGGHVTLPHSSKGNSSKTGRGSIIVDKWGIAFPRKGELFAIMGHTGAGKASLVNVLTKRSSMQIPINSFGRVGSLTYCEASQ
jgi:hypothetical protein